MKIKNNPAIKELKANLNSLLMALVFVTFLAVPDVLFAQAGSFDCSDAGSTVTSFFDNIKGLLGVASVAIVTIAVIFAGYQIAFAHKRISDVAPILIGGFLIGAAGTVASMLIGDTASTSCA